ncbi:hypothetical protein [uncultured Mediterranean phage uvMED]|nr:hypothetical protein [uncultured Mediterranean phage uvMED]
MIKFQERELKQMLSRNASDEQVRRLTNYLNGLQKKLDDHQKEIDELKSRLDDGNT